MYCLFLFCFVKVLILSPNTKSAAELRSDNQFMSSQKKNSCTKIF